MDNTNDKKLIGCKQGYTEETVMEEFAKDDITLRKCDGCSHLWYDGEVCGCDILGPEVLFDVVP